MKKTNASLLLLIFLSLLLTVFFFYPLLGHLNTVLFTGGGDGIKNYFTYLFYINNDTGTHFTGMNYPFGENVVFTDNTPLLAWSINGLGAIFPSIPAHALSIMHAALLLALTIGAIYIFKILKYFNVTNWWAMPSALFIIYFSPQLFRLGGHFGMAFLLYLPMQIYWLMQYNRSGKWKFPAFITALTILCTFLHVYQLAFTLILYCSYLLSYFIIRRRISLRSRLQKVLPILLSMFIACISFALYLKFTDSVSDRTTYPYGVFGSGTMGSDIFTSAITPLGFVFQFLFGKANGPTEGYTYIGFISILVSLFLIYRILRALVLRFSRHTKPATHPVRSFRIWLLVALFELLFAMGVPFVWNLQFLADYVAPLRQFRAMGRFSWSFYYLIMIFCSVFLYRFYQWLRAKEYHWQAKSMTIAILIIWSAQVFGYAQWFEKNLAQPGQDSYGRLYAQNELSWPEWLRTHGYTPEQFQAILALPFFHIGSEKLWLQDNDESRTLYYGLQFALQTGVPMIDVNLSRTSWSQSFATVQLVDGPFSEKPLLDSFSTQPLIILVNKRFPLKPKEEEWLHSAVFIGNRNDIDIYTVKVADVIENGRTVRDSVKTIALQADSREGVIGKNEFLFVNHFDETYQQSTFVGPGAFVPEKREKEQILAEITPGFADTLNHDYFFSIWVHCDSTDYQSPYFIFRQYDHENKLIQESDLSTKYSTHIVQNWYLAEKVLTLNKDMKRLSVLVVGSYIALDELSIWPAAGIYYYKPNDSTLLLNNRTQKYSSF